MTQTTEQAAEARKVADVVLSEWYAKAAIYEGYIHKESADNLVDAITQALLTFHAKQESEVVRELVAVLRMFQKWEAMERDDEEIERLTLLTVSEHVHALVTKYGGGK